MTTNAYTGGYRHTQRGTLILVVTLTLVAVFAAVGLAAPQLKQLWIGVGILLVCAWLFSSLTIEMTERELCWRFGPGLIRKCVSLADIVSARPVKTNFLEGWGIHFSRYGLLYNVSGFDAVAITLRNGKHFALGTDEPQALTARLTEMIQPNQTAGFHA